MAPQRPLLAYDKDCGFCRRFVSRWQRVVGDKVDFRPSVEVADAFPGITAADFAKSVYLVEPDGKITRSAEAVFRALSYAPGHGLPRTLHQHVPPFRWSSEQLYAFVSRHRQLASRVTRPFFPEETEPIALTRSLFLRAVGFVFLLAFASAEVQVDGISGSRGISPASKLFASVREHLTFSDFPSVFWLGASDAGLHFVCSLGIALSVALVFGVAPRLLLIALWFLYLSIVSAGEVFMSFQWDILLIETAMLAALFAPMRLLVRHSEHDPENRGSLFLLRLLLFRLMFASGLVKWRSGDGAWRDMTATTFHYWTQPLPGPLSVYAHFQPVWLHQAQCAVMFVIELVLPFFIFAPRAIRIWIFVPLVAFQLAIAFTGNYGFFSLLTIALCFTLLDDRALLRVLPESLARPHAPWRPAPAWRTVIAVPLVLTFASLGVAELLSRVGFGSVVPRSISSLMEKTRPFATVNSYGLFAVMTKSRPEILLEGSDDGTTWKQYVLPFKPETPQTRPRFLLGHMPRLDWMMWFASLGSCRTSPWFVQLQDGLLRGTTDATKLYEVNPFPAAPPRFLRSTTYQFRFTPLSERGSYWTTTLEGPYCPTLTLQDGKLAVVPL